MKSVKDGDWLPHEISFAIFLGVTSVRLFVNKGDGLFWGLIFSLLLVFVFGLRRWAIEDPQAKRQRIRLLLYFPLMLVSYKACGFAVPILHPGATFILANADQWLLGKDAALFLERWVHPHLTDLFYSLYLFFFVYLGFKFEISGRHNGVLGDIIGSNRNVGRYVGQCDKSGNPCDHQENESQPDIAVIRSEPCPRESSAHDDTV